MKNFWIAINVGLVIASLWGGYNSLAPGDLLHKNPDLISCIAIVVIAPAFAVGIVGYSIRRWKASPLSLPSLDRNPLNWWGDPLQSLFVSTCLFGANALGGLVRQPPVGSVGFWIVGVYCSFALGLLMGQILVYRIYRQYIVSRQ